MSVDSANSGPAFVDIVKRVPNSNYGASVPDLPGCVSTGDLLDEVRNNIRDAIQFHLEGMREDGDPIPEPTTPVEYAEIQL
jgi:predicted RNase H-like HicB family nuclease